MQEHNGQLPADFAALCRLPGLGEYSAGAIASIAFDIRVPAVDGNVLRVAARLMNDARNIEDTSVKKEFRQIVWEVLPQHRVGDFNQSLMELGALICLPNGRPLCESCPVRDLCQSCAAGTQLALPTRQKKPRRRKEEKPYCCCAARERYRSPSAPRTVCSPPCGNSPRCRACTPPPRLRSCSPSPPRP